MTSSILARLEGEGVRRSVSGAALVLGTLSGCGGTTGTPDASAIATESALVTPSGSRAVIELEAGGLRPGTYVASEFAVPFTFTLGDDDPQWTVQWVTPHLVNMGVLGGEMQIFVSPEVHEDGKETALMPAPVDVPSWLSSLPGLEVVETGSVDIGNLSGTGLRLRATGTQSVFLVPPLDPDAPSPQPYGFSINPGGEAAAVGEFTHAIVEGACDEGPLWVTYYTENEAFLPAMEEFLTRLEFAAE